MKLKQTLSVIHFENREKAFQQEQQSTDQTNSFHYDHIFLMILNPHKTYVRSADLFSLNRVELKTS